MSKKMIRSFAAFALVLCMLLTNLGGWNLALAEDTQVEQSEEVNETNETKEEPQENEEEDKEESQVEEPQDENKEENEEAKEPSEEAQEDKVKPLEQNTEANDNLGLGIGGEIVPQAVGAANKPTVKKVSIGDKTVSGSTIGYGQRSGRNLDVTVSVKVNRTAGGTEEKTVTISSTTRSSAWTVNLDSELVVGDKVIVTQSYGNETSEEVIQEVKQTLNITHKDDLTMPTGEIWIEQTNSNIVSEDEKAEAVKMLKDANSSIANDIKSVEFSIDGTSKAYFTVTYTDGSTSGKIEATGLTIKQVTEYSRAAVLGSITIVDNVIKGKLAGSAPFTNIKVQIVLKLSNAAKNSYCDKGKCLTDKDSSNPVDATVNGTTGEFSYTIPNSDLKLDQEVGVIVKEPHKFKSCSKTTVIAPTPKKTEVKDPRKLTSEDKKAIDAAIREAYTVNGESKLPNGTGEYDGVPAVIQIDGDGNAKIFKGNDVAGTWDWNNGGVFVPETNVDGSYKVKENAKPTATYLAKDLLKNKKPEKAEIKINDADRTKITINAKAVDTDANVITISYTGSDDSSKTLKATKADDGTWSITEGEGSVDENGVVTLEVSKVKGGTNVTATVSDKGGIADDDKEALTSDQVEFKITKAILVEALGGLEAVDMKKWVNDELKWKEGIKAKDFAEAENKTKIDALLAEEGTSFSDENSRGTTAEGDFTGKIKVTFDDGSFIEVADQILYVSNLVSPATKANLPDDAIEVEFKLGEGVKVNNVGSAGAVEGNKDKPTSYAKYKVKPNTNLKTYNLPIINSNVVDSIKLTAKDGYTEAKWNTENFVATTSNNVFTATATKTYDITFDANSGTGSMDKVTKKVNETYTLPANTFTPPNENQEFSGWQVGNDTKNLKQANEEITIKADTVIKAIWKPIEFKVSFAAGDGSGNMTEVTVTKGSEYELPACKFTAPSGKEFAGWKVEGQDGIKKAGEKIENVSGNLSLTATWKAKTVTPPNPNPGQDPGSNPDDYKPHRPHRPSNPDKDKDKDNNNNKDKDKNDSNKDPNEPSITENPDGTTTVTPGKKDDPVNITGKDKDGKPIDVVVEKDKDGKWHVDKDAPVSVDPKTGKITIAKGVKDITAKSIIRLERGTHYRYIYGYPDGTVRPEGLITRAEAAALIARIAMLDMSDKAKPNFKDTPSMWYNSAINVVVKKNLMLADDGKFRPNEAITRAEFARALFYIDAKNAAVAPFADVKGHKFEEAINQAYGNGRIAGYPDGTFRPDAFIKRAEAAKILNHYAKRGVDHDGMKGVEVYTTHFTDLNERYWGYYEIMEAANTHEYERRVNTILETWTMINNK